MANWLKRLWGDNAPIPAVTEVNAPTKQDKGVDDRPQITSLPAGRVSQPPTGTTDLIGDQFQIVSPQFMTEIIPIVRALSRLNPDVSQAVHNIVTLGNTGHKISFDRSVPTEQVDKMRNHLINKRKNWAPGQAGMDGQVNKMFSQLLISGALSNEWVPNKMLTGIEANILVNPENIYFKLDKRAAKYQPYQKRTGSVAYNKTQLDGVKLNENTYKYYALNGDEELPYGIPPYLPVVDKIKTQNHMEGNINYIIDIMGLVGFLETLITKPEQASGETEKAYMARLEMLISQAKQRILGGVKDGVIVGFKDDHEFKFNSASKAYGDVIELYKNNELQVASALKQDATLWGRDYGTSQGTMGIIFMKMLSELRNIQNIIATNLEFGYALELRLAGFKFDYLKVTFNRSTIQDDLKFQQAEEIKVRNVKDKLLMGIINLDQAADELGYEVPAEKKPVVPWEVLAGVAPKQEPGLATDGAKKKRTAQDKQNKSARKSRDKAKPTSGKTGK